ncbi:hypothetical protein [Marinimicrobium locisalis]|uniref:hypothetical protein n=1 Tax=Marinimicrobium locisalis TaxID=546022 RepID=UPI003221D025
MKLTQSAIRAQLEFACRSPEGDMLPQFADWAEQQCDKLILACLNDVERELARELDGAWAARAYSGGRSAPARQVDPSSDGSLIELLGHCRQVRRYYQAVCENPNNRAGLAFLRQPRRFRSSR